MFTFLVLCGVFMLSSSTRNEFYLTFSTVKGAECHSAISKFSKGVRCCLDADGNGGAESCTPFTDDSNSQCFTDTAAFDLSVTFEEAKQLCLNRGIGYRLCSVAELSSICAGTGCGVDFTEAWSNEGCLPIYKTAQLFDGQNIVVNEGTSAGETGVGAVRCCTLNEGLSTSICDSEIPGTSTCFRELDGKNEQNQGQITFTTATTICESNGLRLCDINIVKTRAPSRAATDTGGLQTGCGTTGCQVDSQFTWSRTTQSFSPTTWHPTSSPTPAPTFSPTTTPTFTPTSAPTFSPTIAPTSAPTFAPVETPAVAFGQFKEDSNIMSQETVATWDAIYRFEVRTLPTGEKMSLGVDIRPDSNGKPTFKFAKSGIYRINMEVIINNCNQIIEMVTDNILSTVVGRSNDFINRGFFTTSTSFYATINDINTLYVLKQNIQSGSLANCFPFQPFSATIIFISDVPYHLIL